MGPGLGRWLCVRSEWQSSRHGDNQSAGSPPPVSADTGPQCLQGTQTAFSRRRCLQCSISTQAPQHRHRWCCWQRGEWASRRLLLPAEYSYSLLTFRSSLGRFSYRQSWSLPVKFSFRSHFPSSYAALIYSSESCILQGENWGTRESVHLLSDSLLLFSCCISLFVTPWTVAWQAPLSMGFSRQEYWSGLPLQGSGIYRGSSQPISRGSSQPRDWTHFSCGSCIGRQILYH